MADVIISVTIPDAYVIKTLNAFNTIVNTHLTIEARGSSPNPKDDFDGRWDFRIAPKDAGETNIQFGQRVFRELGKAIINMVDLAEDNKRYRDTVKAIAPPVSDVPDGVLL